MRVTSTLLSLGLAVLFSLDSRATGPKADATRAKIRTESQRKPLDQRALLEDHAASLCQAMKRPMPGLELTALFTAESLQASPQLITTLTRSFESIAKLYGDCQSIALPEVDRTEGRKAENWTPVFFQLDSRNRSVWSLKLETPRQKLSGIRLLGVIPAAENLHIRELRVAMRDGLHLRTLVFTRPGEERARPTVLMRTPYFKDQGHFAYGVHYRTANYYVSRGYNFVLQSMRGLHGSEGEPQFINPLEPKDAADTIAWILRQDFANDRVAAVGTSYDGYGALTAGIENPPGLKLILSGASPIDSSTGTFNYNGVVALIALEYIHYLTTGEGPPFSGKVANHPQLVGELDLRRYDQIVYGRTLPEWQRFATAYARSDHPYWRERSHLKALNQIDIPTYHIAGLRLDGNMNDSVNSFLEVQKNSPYRDRHHLILGHWDHGNNTAYADGDNLHPFMKERFDQLLAHYLRDEPTEVVREKKVQIASHFGDRFHASDSYPLKNLKEMTLFLGSQQGKGRLSRPPSSEAAATSYLYDPVKTPAADDVGALFEYKAAKDLPLLGSLHFDLYLQIDAPQTDISFLLMKKDQQGQRQSITQCGAFQRVHRQALIRIQKESCPVMAMIKAGETLVLTAYSGAYPVLARNTNNPESHFYDGHRPARIKILHSPEHPSRITLRLEPGPSTEENLSTASPQINR